MLKCLSECLVERVEGGDELNAKDVGAVAGQVLDLQPLVAALEQLMPVEPPASAELVGGDQTANWLVEALLTSVAPPGACQPARPAA